MSDKKLKKICFTLNNPEPSEETRILDWIEQYAIFAVLGHEIGEHGTPHIQGYVNTRKQTRFTAVKKIMPRAHLEIAKGSDQQNLAYCTKEDKNAFVFGEPQSPGKRNDLSIACKMATSGSTVSQIANECPEAYVKYTRGIHSLTEQLQKPRDVDKPPVVLWLYGLAGTGKTRFAYDHFSQDAIYIKDGTQWWNNYNHEHVILVDDFDGRWPYRDLLRFLDRYPYQGQTKGGYVHVNSPVIIITCEFPPDHFWLGNELQQVIRRITQVVHTE